MHAERRPEVLPRRAQRDHRVAGRRPDPLAQTIEEDGPAHGRPGGAADGQQDPRHGGGPVAGRGHAVVAARAVAQHPADERDERGPAALDAVDDADRDGREARRRTRGRAAGRPRPSPRRRRSAGWSGRAAAPSAGRRARRPGPSRGAAAGGARGPGLRRTGRGTRRRRYGRSGPSTLAIRTGWTAISGSLIAFASFAGSVDVSGGPPHEQVRAHQGREGRPRRLPGAHAGRRGGLGDARRRRPHAPQVVRALRAQRQGRPLHAARRRSSRAC